MLKMYAYIPRWFFWNPALRLRPSFRSHEYARWSLQLFHWNWMIKKTNTKRLWGWPFWKCLCRLIWHVNTLYDLIARYQTQHAFKNAYIKKCNIMLVMIFLLCVWIVCVCMSSLFVNDIPWCINSVATEVCLHWVFPDADLLFIAHNRSYAHIGFNTMPHPTIFSPWNEQVSDQHPPHPHEHNGCGFYAQTRCHCQAPVVDTKGPNRFSA